LSSIKPFAAVLFKAELLLLQLTKVLVDVSILLQQKENNLIDRETSMNKAELIEKIAKDTDQTKAQTERMLDATLGIIKKSVKKGDEVKLVGFGTFAKHKRKARTGRNPQTGKAIKIPAAWYPKFRPGTDFKNLLK
jgi:DNA-binding protein HU-beta